MEPERCAECGFDASRLSVGDAITALRTMGRRWNELFKGVPVEVLRRRPAPDVWSPLEYAAHTRDVLDLHAFGLNEILKGQDPEFPVIEPDEGAPDHGYNTQEPAAVLEALAKHATRIADRAADVVGADPWSRTATVGDNKIDAGWLLRHGLHDASHHVRDVQRILGR
jgi:S-DNA-T family DNA segregation ATPase FtsK/SpoIIIE